MTTIVTHQCDDYKSRIEGLCMPRDQEREAIRALESGDESMVIHHRDHGSAQATHYLMFPTCQRGAIADGGDSVWTDCLDLDDLVDRWRNPDRLSN